MRASSISTLARAPNVHQVFTPLMSQPPSVGVAVTLTPATSEPKSGSVTATAAMTSAEASFGSHACFCSSVPPASSAAGEDLGPGDQRAAGAERAARQLLGGHDHADVLALAALGVAAVLLGHRQAEAAHLGEALDDVLGDVVVLAVDVLGDRADLLVGEAPEGVLHQLEVGVEVAGAAAVGQRGQERRLAVGGDELAGVVERAGLDAPLGLAAEQLGGQLGDGVGDEGAGHRGLDVALLAVGEHRPAGLDRGRGVGQVVGQHLLGVDRRFATAGSTAPATTSWARSTTALAAARSGVAASEERLGGHARRLPTGSRGPHIRAELPIHQGTPVSYTLGRAEPRRAVGDEVMARCHTHGAASIGRHVPQLPAASSASDCLVYSYGRAPRRPTASGVRCVAAGTSMPDAADAIRVDSL